MVVLGLAGACSPDDSSQDSVAERPIDRTTAAGEDAGTDPVAAAGTTGTDPTRTGDPTTDPDHGSDGDPSPLDGSTAEAEAVAWSLDDALAADPGCAAPVTGDGLRVGYGADFGDPVDRIGGDTASLLADLVSCSGGVAGGPVEVRVVDVGGSALATRRAVGELLDWGVDAILGPRLAGPGLRMREIVAGRVPIVFATSTDPALDEPTARSFTLAADDAVRATAGARFALNQGWRSAVTFSSPGPYYGYGPSVFATAFEAGGGTLVSNHGYEPGVTADFAAEVEAIGAAGPPEVIFTAMPTDQLIVLRDQIIEEGFESVLLTVEAPALTGGRARGLDGVHYIEQLPTDREGRVAQLDRLLRQTTGSTSSRPTAAARVGDGLAVIVDAYLRSGQGPPPAIADAIAEGATVDGFTGPVNPIEPTARANVVDVLEIVDGIPTLVATIRP